MCLPLSQPIPGSEAKSRGVALRLRWVWYLAAVLLIPSLLAIALWVATLTGEALPPMPAFAQPIGIPIAFVIIFLLGGPLQEEFGWRGYATEQLQKKWNALIVALVMGFVWTAWHLPLFFIPRSEAYYNNPILGVYITATLVTILITWIYNNTNRSIFAAMLIHTSWNWGNHLFPTLFTQNGALTFLILAILVIAAILITSGTHRMVRTRSQID